MTVDEIIEGILEREQQGQPPYLTPGDAGGRTSWGISERAHPDAWIDGPPTRERAKQMYESVYAKPFRALDVVGVDDRIRACLIDDAVMRSVPHAITRFQHVLGVPMDGILGPITAQAAAARDQVGLLKAIVVERAVRITRLVERRPSDLRFLTGWITRILTFLP